MRNKFWDIYDTIYKRVYVIDRDKAHEIGGIVSDVNPETLHPLGACWVMGTVSARIPSPIYTDTDNRATEGDFMERFQWDVNNENSIGF